MEGAPPVTFHAVHVIFHAHETDTVETQVSEIRSVRAAERWRLVS